MKGIEAAVQGRVGKDPDFRMVKNGTMPLLAFSIAVDDDFQDTTWINVVAFTELAEGMRERVQKGISIYCEGKLTLEHYTGKDGQPRASLKLVAALVQPLGQVGKRRSAGAKAAGGSGTSAARRQAAAAQAPVGGPAPYERDEAPPADLDDPLPW